MTVIIDKFGRVLIPKDLRDRLGLTPGTRLSLDVHDAGDTTLSLALRPVENSEASIDSDDGLVDVGGRLVHNGNVDRAAQDVTAFIKSERARRFRRLGGLEPDDR